MNLKADMIFAFLSGLFLAIAAWATSRAYTTKKKYEVDRQEKVKNILEEANEIAKKQTASKSIDELMSDRLEQLGADERDKTKGG